MKYKTRQQDLQKWQNGSKEIDERVKAFFTILFLFFSFKIFCTIWTYGRIRRYIKSTVRAFYISIHDFPLKLSF